MKIKPQYKTDGIYIKDMEGRTILFRGCNLGGDSKIPFTPQGNPLSYDVSFIGRPFKESDADEHFARIASWGFNLVRFVITWEAVEHAGPGIYDEEYLSYLRAILKKAHEYKIAVIIDPHQDVWSRWTGGDGAPGWTLEAAGFNLDAISSCEAALTVQGLGTKYKKMCWGLNYLYYAAATMNTLFFGGNTYAKGRLVEGYPIQDWLQSHFIDAMQHTARRLKDCDAIIGFGIFNEPHGGFIGLRSLHTHGRITAPSGVVPTAFQSMLAASGYSQKVSKYLIAGKIKLPGSYDLNPLGFSLFREGYGCPWKEAGVWSDDGGSISLHKDDYFSGVSFCNEFLKPFHKKFMEAVSKKHEHYMFFSEGVPMAEHIDWSPSDFTRADGEKLSVVDEIHWYDGLSLLFGRWFPWITADSETSAVVLGSKSVRKSIFNQLQRMAKRGRTAGLPVFVGEFGIQFNLENGRFLRSKNWKIFESALALWYSALDASFLHATIWNYSASNTDAEGDGWNGENLSILNASYGVRAIKGFCRPYAIALSGTPLEMSFSIKKRIFSVSWKGISGKSEIFIPNCWYPQGWTTEVVPEPASTIIVEEKPENQRLFVSCEADSMVKIRVKPL